MNDAKDLSKCNDPKYTLVITGGGVLKEDKISLLEFVITYHRSKVWKN